MITKIKGKHFKSGDFIHELGKLNLFVGGNGSGKTAVSQALCLAVNGGVPGVGKTNPAIFQAVTETGSDFVAVEVTINGNTSFLRRYKKGTDGAVALDMLVNGRKATAQAFNAEMGRVGVHAVGDLSSFIGVSEKKKIDEIYSKYPPGPELAGIDNALNQAREELNEKTRAARDLEKVLTQHKHARTGIPLPEIPLSKCVELIEQRKAELARLIAAQNPVDDSPKGSPPTPIPAEDYQEKKPESGAKVLPFEPKPAAAVAEKTVQNEFVDFSDTIPRQAALESLKSVLGAVQRSGCGDTCVALMIIKREIKNLKQWGKM